LANATCGDEGLIRGSLAFTHDSRKLVSNPRPARITG
jgi:hypothetical protein